MQSKLIPYNNKKPTRSKDIAGMDFMAKINRDLIYNRTLNPKPMISLYFVLHFQVHLGMISLPNNPVCLMSLFLRCYNGFPMDFVNFYYYY